VAVSARQSSPLFGRIGVFLLLLLGLFFVYTAVILFGNQPVSVAVRVALLGALLAAAARLRRRNRVHLAASAGAGVACVVIVLLVLAVGSQRAAYGVTGLAVAVLAGAIVTLIISALVAVRRVDAATVLGVLCVYLLIALIFAAVGQVAAAFQYGQDQYVRGVFGAPTASDLLYLSVITLCTVGYGDIVPVSEVARALSVVESLTGQLYLVSIVAAVVAGWRPGEAARADRRTEPGPDSAE
jgi:hypothetical protein